MRKLFCHVNLLLFIALTFSLFAQEDKRAARIVSLSPVLSEIVFALGAGELLVGRTDWCDYPSEISAVPSVGGFSGSQVSIESIRSLRADTVLLSPFMHERLIPILQRAGIRIVGLDPNSFVEIFDSIEVIAGLCDRKEEGRILRASLEGRLDELAAARASLSATRGAGAVYEIATVFYLLQDEPLMSAGRKSFISMLIETAGGRNIFDDVEQAWPLVSMEELLVRRPRFILVDTGTFERVFPPANTARGRRGALSRLDAVRSDRLIVMDPAVLGRAGPRMVETAWALARALGTVP